MLRRAHAIIIAACLSATPVVAQETEPVEVSPEAYRQVEILMRAVETVRENYVDADQVTYEKMMQAALDGIFDHLDEHSEYVSPARLQQLRSQSINPNNTAGISVEQHEGGLRVTSVAEGGPAARAGIKIGDRLLEIDGADAAGLDSKAASALLDGAPGKSLTVEYLRPGTTRARAAGFRREQPVLDSVTGVEILPGEGAKIGYARVRAFEASTPRELADALDVLADGGMEALIIDLRDNPGGVLEAAVDLCAQFLPANTLVARTRGRADTDHSAEYRTPATDRPVRELPLALLINDESASSSEIVAGALKDHNRAILIGDNTYGKGSVQTIVQMGLDTGAAMRLTTARFFTPKGKGIDRVGVAPDMKSDGPMETAAAQLRKTLKTGN